MACICVKAQTGETPAPPPPAWLFNPALRSTQSRSLPYTIRVFVHIVRSNSGTGLGSGIVNTIISRLNSDFAGSGIQFQSGGTSFIDNTYYNQLSPSQYQTLFNINSHSHAIDIYVLGTSTQTNDVNGYASSISSTAYWVHGSVYNTSTLSHEMGHCLGLYHTHHGTVTESGGDTNQCKELVNGSNGATCGDYIADTPADPRLWNGCNYSGGSNIKDANGQTYNPSSTNIMSYANNSCRTSFTSMQHNC